MRPKMLRYDYTGDRASDGQAGKVIERVCIPRLLASGDRYGQRPNCGGQHRRHDDGQYRAPFTDLYLKTEPLDRVKLIY